MKNLFMPNDPPQIDTTVSQVAKILATLFFMVATLGVGLSGCAGTNAVLPNVPPQIDTTVSQVQSIATTLCKFEPTAATVVKILATISGAGGIADVASNIAASICSAITSKSAVRGRVPTLHGVVLNGRYVR